MTVFDANHFLRSIVKVPDAFQPLAKWKLGVTPVEFIKEIDTLPRGLRCQAMLDELSFDLQIGLINNVEHRVGNLENESLRDGREIERLKKEDAVLENDISTLLLLLENFFVWPSSAPRYGDAQNAAFDKIQELLKEMRQRYPLEPA